MESGTKNGIILVAKISLVIPSLLLFKMSFKMPAKMPIRMLMFLQKNERLTN